MAFDEVSCSLSRTRIVERNPRNWKHEKQLEDIDVCQAR